MSSAYREKKTLAGDQALNPEGRHGELEVVDDVKGIVEIMFSNIGIMSVTIQDKYL